MGEFILEAAMMQSEEEKIAVADGCAGLSVAGWPAGLRGAWMGAGQLFCRVTAHSPDGLAWNLGLEVKRQTPGTSEVWRRSGCGCSF